MKDLLERLVQRLESHQLDARDKAVLKDARTSLAQLELLFKTPETSDNALVRELAHALLAVDCHGTNCNAVLAFREDLCPNGVCDCYMKKRDEVLALLKAAGRLA